MIVVVYPGGLGQTSLSWWISLLRDAPRAVAIGSWYASFFVAPVPAFASVSRARSAAYSLGMPHGSKGSELSLETP